MNDDAKFFFFLSGFTGFVFFYSFSMILNRDPILSLIYGSSGSLFFSLLGRSLLISALRKVLVSRQEDEVNDDEVKKNVPNTDFSSKDKNNPVVKSSLKANKEAVSSNSVNLRSLGAKK
tara:strand:+ start:441 stop:797 length:357 start_codon:yes stop_codon:yes gene_type:complete